MAARDISIIVLTYNRRDCLAELMTELRELDGHVREVIVVDNCSTDGTARMLADEFPFCRVLRNDVNVGVAARNLGLRQAVGAVAVTIDDDIMGLGVEDLDLIERSFREQPRLGSLNFQVRDWFSRQTCNWVHHRPIDDCELQFDTYEITEGAVAFRREAVLEFGGYCESYFISHEGPDLAYRLMNRGYDVRYDGRVVVYHKHEQRSREPWRFYYYDSRNLLWLAMRNMPWRDAVPFLLRSVGAMFVYAVRDRHLRWWFRAMRDGLRGVPRMLREREPWTSETRRRCREIDRHRPGFWRLMWLRLRQPANRLDG